MSNHFNCLSAFIRVYLRFQCFLIFLLLSVSAAAQQAPAGNNLPTPSINEDALDHALEPHDHDGHDHAHITREQHQQFADALDLSSFRKLAVFDDGRAKILDTLAREQLTRVYGKPRWKDVSAETATLPPGQRDDVKYDPVFTYLDLVFNRAYYEDKPILYVEVLPFRERLLAHLPQEEQERWKKLGRISLAMFASPQVQAVYREADAGINESKARDQLYFAASSLVNASDKLMLASPRPNEDQWAHISEAQSHSPSVMPAGQTVPLGLAINSSWVQLEEAWLNADADSANHAIAQLAVLLPELQPATYPSPLRRSLELFYNRTGKFTIGYAVYALATLFLILALGTGRRWLFTLGTVFLIGGFLAHATSFGIRATLSGRWAIHNQYESFIAISLFAVLVGIILMFARKQWVFGTAAAALGTLSLLVANLWAIPSSEVGQVAAILATSRILYVHVNMVLVSYGLIALSFFVSLFYLAAHYLPDASTARFAAAAVRSETLEGEVKTPGRKGLLHDLDKAQLLLMQLAFWLLGTGIILGAYWADHSWGRWWAWDPKETWALITWIVYLIAIHARLGVKNRGLVTAWLSVTGFIVMLWTYWGVNLLLSGLHSYA